MPIITTPIAGTSGRVIINGATVYLNKFEVVETADDIETTHFESVGTDGHTYEEGITGKISAEVTLSGFYNESATLAFLNLYVGVGQIAGEVYPVISCYLDKGVSTLFYGFPATRILGVTIAAGVNDKEVKITLKFKNKGSYVRPS